MASDVKLALGRTIKTGDFEFVRIDLEVTVKDVPDSARDDTIQQLYASLKNHMVTVEESERDYFLSSSVTFLEESNTKGRFRRRR